MKKFSFPLDRVLVWRQTQVRLAEAGLSRLRAELTAADRERTALEQSVLDARRQLVLATQTNSVELAALENYRNASDLRQTRIAQKRRQLEQSIAQQVQTVQERRREARLLEKLRETRLAAWKADAAREIDQLAEESYQARLARVSARP